MWNRLYSCPLSKPKVSIMSLGEVAEGAPASVLRVDIKPCRRSSALSRSSQKAFWRVFLPCGCPKFWVLFYNKDWKGFRWFFILIYTAFSVDFFFCSLSHLVHLFLCLSCSTVFVIADWNRIIFRFWKASWSKIAKPSISQNGSCWREESGSVNNTALAVSLWNSKIIICTSQTKFFSWLLVVKIFFLYDLFVILILIF